MSYSSIQLPENYNCVETFIDSHIEEGRGDRIAIYYKDKVYTYEDLYKNVNKVGNFLKKLGIERENRVLLMVPDSPELVFSFFGAMKIAAVPIPVNTRLTPQLYAYMLNDSRAKAVMVHKDLLDSFKAIEKELKFLKYKIIVEGEDQGYLSFQELLDSASPELTPEETHKDEMAFWLYTSGSTGAPKGVVHLHHDLIHISDLYAKNVLKVVPEDVSLSVSKIFHAYGLGNSIAFPFRFGASTVLISEVPKPDLMLKAIDEYKVTLFYGVPTFYASCLAMDKIEEKYSLKSLRLCVSAGEPLPAIIYKKWLEKFNVEILDGIGSTEVLHIYLSNFPNKVKPGSLGFPVPGYEVKIVDEEGNTIEKENEVGILWVKGESTTPYFWNKHEKTKKQCIGEWFNTDDLFYKDSDGYYWYYGRSDDAFKYKGEWVVPVEIENVIIEHPSVLENAVIGVKDTDGLTKPMAMIVLKESHEPSEELAEEIKSFVRTKLPGYKVPYWIRFVKELPKTATGKIQRYKLRQEMEKEKK